MSRIAWVPGGQIVRFNEVGPRLLVRCEAALELFRSGGADFILLTGGLTHSREVQDIPEAELMRRWFVCEGVPEHCLLVEGDSVDSCENVEFGLRLLQSRGIEADEFIIVSQWQHALRLLLSLKWGWGVSAKTRIVPLFPRIGLRGFLVEVVFLAYHAYDPCGRLSVIQKRRERIRLKWQ
jgi:vancomycin permeability regulator SanA